MKTAENLEWRVNKIVTSEPEYHISRSTWSHNLIIP